MPSEDTILFLAVDHKFTEMSAVAKTIGEFFKTKSSFDPTDRFNLLFYTDKGPIFVEDFTFKTDFLLNLFSQYLDRIEKPVIESGMMLVLTFILNIYKLVSGKYFRILVIKDASGPEITKDAFVNDFMDKVKPMPVFLDVISLGSNTEHDMAKLQGMINASQGGTLASAMSVEDFQEIMEKEATIKKAIKIGTWDKGPDFKMIDDADHKAFFENLAANLEPVEHLEANMKCTVCAKPTSPVGGTEAFVSCPSCKTMFHDTCLVSWAKQSNIGIENVFRCPICFYLVMLPQVLVDEVSLGQFETFESYLQEIDQDALLKQKDAKRELNVVLRELEI
ncbi:MAG TPA: hypothetical protein VKM55_06240 [Candidatus Lokiarchaeia archaeon]|nr:hypothetical protein [Candidatus Lokiarchaeia archaeon]